MKRRTISALIMMSALLLAVTSISEYDSNVNRSPKFEADFKCIRTVCIKHDTAGDMCTVLGPSLATIVVEVDPINGNYSNVLITPSDNQCN